MNVDIDVKGEAWKKLRRMTGEDDKTILVRAVATYSALLEQTTDHVIVIQREDGKRLHIGLTAAGEDYLKSFGLPYEGS